MDVRLAVRGDGCFDRVADGVFDHRLIPARLDEFLEDDRHHIAVAIDDSTIVGMASAVHYVHPDKSPELWINEVGVAPTHRRRGLARRLIERLLEHGRGLGCEEAWVLTDRDNEGARSLYGSLAPHEEQDDVVMYSWRLTVDQS